MLSIMACETFKKDTFKQNRSLLIIQISWCAIIKAKHTLMSMISIMGYPNVQKVEVETDNLSELDRWDQKSMLVSAK